MEHQWSDGWVWDYKVHCCYWERVSCTFGHTWLKHIHRLSKNTGVWITSKFLKGHFRAQIWIYLSSTTCKIQMWRKLKECGWSWVGTSKRQPPQLICLVGWETSKCSITYFSRSLNTSMMDSQTHPDDANKNLSHSQLVTYRRLVSGPQRLILMRPLASVWDTLDFLMTQMSAHPCHY